MLTNASFAFGERLISVSCVNGRQFSLTIVRPWDGGLRTSDTFRCSTPVMRKIMAGLQSAEHRHHTDERGTALRVDLQSIQIGRDDTFRVHLKDRESMRRFRLGLSLMVPLTPTELREREERLKKKVVK